MGPTAVEKGHAFDEATEAGREPFKVADLALASFGRNEIRLADAQFGALRPGTMLEKVEPLFPRLEAPETL